MPHLTRRHFLSSTVAVGASLSHTRLMAQGAERRGGVLVVAADTEPRNLNPALVASNGVFYVASKIIEPLAEMGADGALIPRLATSWDGSSDGRSVRFHLRDGVTWHDGRPFSSADVAFSALQLWKPLQNLGRVVFKDLEAVETPEAKAACVAFAHKVACGQYYKALADCRWLIDYEAAALARLERSAA